METKNMSLPHSAVHARNHESIKEKESKQRGKTEPGVKGMVSFLSSLVEERFGEVTPCSTKRTVHLCIHCG